MLKDPEAEKLDRERELQEARRRSWCKNIDSDRGGLLLQIRSTEFEIGSLERTIRDVSQELIVLRIELPTSAEPRSTRQRIDELERQRERDRDALRIAKDNFARLRHRMSELRSEFLRNRCDDWFPIGPEE